MKKNIIYIFTFALLLIFLYVLFLRFPSVIYYGETENWQVELRAKLIATEESYEIKFRFKGEDDIDHFIFDIYPHYGVGWVSEIVKNQEFIYKCEGCGYYDHDEELLMFIKWKDEKKDSNYESELFTLKKK